MKAVVDNTVLSNFALIHGEILLKRIFSGELYTTEEVLHELYIGEQRNIIPWRRGIKVELKYPEKQSF